VNFWKFEMSLTTTSTSCLGGDRHLDSAQETLMLLKAKESLKLNARKICGKLKVYQEKRKHRLSNSNGRSQARGRSTFFWLNFIFTWVIPCKRRATQMMVNIFFSINRKSDLLLAILTLITS